MTPARKLNKRASPVETGAAHFLAKRKRDARAHLRIVRHHPAKQNAAGYAGTRVRGLWADGDAADAVFISDPRRAGG